MSKTVQTNIIGLKELRNSFPKYIRGIENGESFIVVKHSRPVFKISPVENEIWEPVADLTQVKPNGVPASQLLKAIDKML